MKHAHAVRNQDVIEHAGNMTQQLPSEVRTLQELVEEQAQQLQNAMDQIRVLQDSDQALQQKIREILGQHVEPQCALQHELAEEAPGRAALLTNICNRSSSPILSEPQPFTFDCVPSSEKDTVLKKKRQPWGCNFDERQILEQNTSGESGQLSKVKFS